MYRSFEAADLMPCVPRTDQLVTVGSAAVLVRYIDFNRIAVDWLKDVVVHLAFKHDRFGIRKFLTDWITSELSLVIGGAEKLNQFSENFIKKKCILSAVKFIKSPTPHAFAQHNTHFPTVLRREN